MEQNQFNRRFWPSSPPPPPLRYVPCICLLQDRFSTFLSRRLASNGYVSMTQDLIYLLYIFPSMSQVCISCTYMDQVRLTINQACPSINQVCLSTNQVCSGLNRVLSSTNRLRLHMNQIFVRLREPGLPVCGH